MQQRCEVVTWHGNLHQNHHYASVSFVVIIGGVKSSTTQNTKKTTQRRSKVPFLLESIKSSSETLIVFCLPA